MLCLPEKVEAPKRPCFKLLRTISSGLGIGSAMIGSVVVASAAGETSNAQYSDWSSIITTAQGQINVGTVVGVLASTVGACVALVFMWWGVRKGVRMLMSAFKKGKLRV